MRRTELARAAELKRGARLKRNTALRGGGTLPRAELKRVPRGGTRKSPGGAVRKHAGPRRRRDTIPRPVRELVATRDKGWCQWCGAPGSEIHHRRIKGIGGDKRPCTDCACNLVLLCPACHAAAHRRLRVLAERHGMIISRFASDPPRLAAVTRLGRRHEDGRPQWPSCTGEWLDQDPALRDAA